MNTEIDFLQIAPELFLLIAACVILIVDVLTEKRWRTLTFHLTQVSVVVTGAMVILLHEPGRGASFHNMFIADTLSAVLKIFVLLVSYYVFFYSKSYLEERGQLKGEFFILGLFAVLGMMVLVSAASLLTVYLGLELLSLSLYALVALNRDSTSASEAAMKYFVLGALASGMLLYGMSLVYGVAGTIELSALSASIASLGAERDLVLVLGLVFVVVGIAFKLGAVPFHMWVPDVYEGAPTAVTLFIGTAPKIAAFGMLIRLLVDGLGGLHADWSQMLALLAVLSMAAGNIVAISQTNIKRMLAYSTIAHVGFIFVGVVAASAAGYAASMFYVIAYALMALGAFGIIIALSRDGFESEQLDDFRGLKDRNPLLALLMLFLMLSMAGVPPFLGFWAKWSVLREAVAAGYVWLAVVGVVLSVVGLFYYLRVIRLMYFEEAEDLPAATPGADMRVMVGTNALAILALGLYPGGVLHLCQLAWPQ